jgi:hypothetical protein
VAVGVVPDGVEAEVAVARSWWDPSDLGGSPLG